LFRTLGILLVCCCAALAGTARADDLADIDRMVGQGHTQEAMARLDKLLAQRPQDAPLRFRKGVLLTWLHRTDEAAAVFMQLNVDYPELPEPYNNLAVIHAARGNYDQARAELESALRANPSYAVAQQNLADVYAQLARLSYERALNLDPANAAIPPKLALLHDLVRSINAEPALHTAPSR
jgi:Flp pilus assembly protein TadD